MLLRKTAWFWKSGLVVISFLLMHSVSGCSDAPPEEDTVSETVIDVQDVSEEEQENEEKLFNLHNHLIWHSYRPFEDALTDAIFSAVIQKIIEDYNLTPQDVPADYRDLLE